MYGLIQRSRAFYTIPRVLNREHQFIRSLFLSAELESRGLRNKMVSMMARVADVDIDPSGKFKYILIELSEGGQKKTIVRGYRRSGYHADIFDEVTPALEKQGIRCSCPGGGRIEHNPGTKTISVYGYSMGFGQADHKVTVDILKRQFPSYSSITSSNEGY